MPNPTDAEKNAGISAPKSAAARSRAGASVPPAPAGAAATDADRPQVKPRAEGWTQAVDAEGRPKLQFAQSKRVKQPPTHLADLSMKERIAKAQEMGLPGFRAKQLSVHYFQHYTSDPAAMTDLPAADRDALVEEFLPPLLTEVRRLKTDDGATIKFLWRLFDGALVESVLMRYRNRITLCISSQCGCGMNCPFCATGQNGLTRNMSTAEIVDQIVQANRVIAAGELDAPNAVEVAEEATHAGLGEEADFAEGEAPSSSPGEKTGPQRVGNIVFMGMGEPLANYKRVMNAVRRMIDPAPEGLGMSARGITVSTVGLVPAIKKLADENLPITFALSLHAPDDELRDELIPVNSRWKADEAIDAAYYYYQTTGRRVSIEYALIKDMNDHPWRADLLGDKLNARGRGWVHVNPIPLNPTPNSVWTSSEPEVMREFIARLEDKGVPTTLRDTRGKEIDGACGQLAAAED
ncbi:23S rRNA (adenine(2503)-C(2))-methyltransferase RlmN [Nesterenkonia flava]|uniref:Probable dual-specificity RNA methyltransferase RlmN n=1 Tax=Nesterenkonia flava TaxID=469799 RepID=A0ABU1FVL6_9MICC|nr:23S rRNA (adenine(2503)-C(2))-methyltransferase RlmN [Nesterenkonia flava]MDR5712708.1 23S rRNA (adenine(2503)-C(2))-methyltransferase RlmN [Nesterenkonia flava]